MASTIPTQNRVIDPFASYNSNVVNQMCHVVTQNSDGLLTTNSLQVTLDSTSPTTTVIVSPGFAIKDDVLINITSNHIVDFTDGDNYASGAPLPMTGGYYYIVLEYVYIKSRPAPQAHIKILKPTDSFTSRYLLLKVVEISAVNPHPITALYDYDPSHLTIKREYIKYYAGSVVDLPTFNQTRDQSRIAYETARDKYYFGYNSGWRELSAGGISTDINTDSTGVVVGSLCYVDENRNAIPALATSFETGADVAVLSIGTAISGKGRGSVAGFVEGVPVETGIGINIGDLLYLSATEAGKVTNIKTASIFQVVGRALTAGSQTTPVDIIFSPKIVLCTGIEGQISSWDGPDGVGNFYSLIDVSNLDGTNAFDCHWFDNSDHTEIVPAKVQILGNGNYIKISMLDATVTVDYVILSASSIGGAGGGGGGGGGGGITDHSLLSSLDYASSGHTGFAPSPHGNGHHSETYITTSGVTYGALDANGDVGTGAGQLAIGNHTHPGYVDIPTGEVILFESDTAVAGYTLLTTQDDAVVYITKGSASGGEVGGTQKDGSTWSQPAHDHSIPTEPDHSHTGGDHVLTVSEMPPHRHYLWDGCISQPYDSCYGGTPVSADKKESGSVYTDYEGGGNAHNHGATSSDGLHNHGGTVGLNATVSSWRPFGYNYTRQQRI